MNEVSRTEYTKAVLNILEDLTEEKAKAEDAQRAVMNILEDLAEERTALQETRDVLVRSEQAMRASLREKDVLLKEIHHRVKNNLQVISSLLNLQARHLSDDAARAMFRDSQNRVQSIALVHERLYQSRDLARVDFDAYLSSLLDGLLHAHAAVVRGVEATVSARGLDLPVDVAIPCGLIVNELVTNALKHAFHGRSGRVRITAERAGDTIVLAVADDGVGMPAGLDPARARTLGLDLVNTFAEQLRARLEVEREGGTVFRLTFPAPAEAAR